MKKLLWPKEYKNVCIGAFVLDLVMLFATIFTQQDAGVIIVFSLLCLLLLILVLYIFLYKITVYDDRFEIRSIFGYKKYHFNEVISVSLSL